MEGISIVQILGDYSRYKSLNKLKERIIIKTKEPEFEVAKYLAFKTEQEQVDTVIYGTKRTISCETTFRWVFSDIEAEMLKEVGYSILECDRLRTLKL